MLEVEKYRDRPPAPDILGRERIVSLQILRFFAASMVVAAHSINATTFRADGRVPMPSLAGIGASGVDIFFVISGFIIARVGPLASRRPSGAQFFWRRWCRVGPIYYLLSAPQLIWALAAGSFAAPAAIATFLFWPVFANRLVEPFNAFGWTLELEFVFYVAMSLFLVAGRLRRNGALLFAIFVILTAGRLATGWVALRFLTSPVFIEFGIGVFFALAWPTLKRAPAALGIVTMAVAFGALAAEALGGIDLDFQGAKVIDGAESFRRLIDFGFPAAGIVAGALICERFARGRAAEFAAKLGDASYSIYLTQGIVGATFLGVAVRLFGIGLMPLLWAFTFLGCVGAGVVVYRAIERPIIRDLRRLRWPPGKTAPAAAAVAE